MYKMRAFSISATSELIANYTSFPLYYLYISALAVLLVSFLSDSNRQSWTTGVQFQTSVSSFLAAAYPRVMLHSMYGFFIFICVYIKL